MIDRERLDQLEKRMQAMTNTLIQIQIEMEKLRESVNAVTKKETIVSETVQTETPKAEVIQSVTTAAEVVYSKPETINADMTPGTAAIQPSSLPGRKQKKNIEAFIGGKLLTIIGIVVLVFGIGFFVKYAIDADLIGPIGRVTLGLLAGLGLVALAFRLKAQYRAFSAVLLSGGMATIYFSVFAAFDFYHLIPREWAFTVMVLLTAFTALAAIMYDLEIIGLIGLVGAYAVPILLSDHSGRIFILLSYMTVVNIGICVLSFLKNWKILTQCAQYLSWLIFLLWFVNYYDDEKHFTMALGFSSAFFMFFYLMAIGFKLLKKISFSAVDVITLTTNSFIYYGIGYGVFQNIYDGAFLGLITLGFALIHILFGALTLKARLADKRFFFLQIGLALTFLVIAVPVQLEGNWVTLIWSLGAFLLFAIGRTQKTPFYENISYILVILSLFSLFHDWYDYRPGSELLAWTPVLNVMFMISIIVLLSLSGMMWLSNKEKYKYAEKSSLDGIVQSGIKTFLILIAYIVLYREISWFFEKLYFLSAVEISGEWLHTIYDEDIFKFRSLWLFNYTALFLSALSLLILHRKRYPVLRLILLIAGLIAALVFLFSVLTDLGQLRSLYLINPNDMVFSQGPFYIAIRYICYTFAGLLFYVVGLLMKDQPSRLRKGYAIFMHIIVLAVLSSEVTTWVVLANAKEKILESAQWSRQVWYSVLWGLYSLVIVGYGILKKVRYLRIAAIALFGVTLIKVSIFDLYDLPTGGKIIVFIGLGMLLLAVAFLYQKFKPILFGSGDDEKNS